MRYRTLENVEWLIEQWIGKDLDVQVVMAWFYYPRDFPERIENYEIRPDLNEAPPGLAAGIA